LRELALDREDMLELVGNLLDNACKWAASRAVLRLSIEQGTFVLVIEDDGPGVPEPQRERLLERGLRLDERVEGHGLGLSIVREIVDSYDGRLELDDSELGGLRVVVRLPF
jgi:signal transduction histidine kinase